MAAICCGVDSSRSCIQCQIVNNLKISFCLKNCLVFMCNNFEGNRRKFELNVNDDNKNVLKYQGDPDKPIKDTSQDAVSSRWSSASKGYFEDPYVKLFFSGNTHKPPLINRGTFFRTRTIDFFVKRFLKKQIALSEKSQIVSLGAGMDTRFFVLKDSLDFSMDSVAYFEIDFPDIVDKKCQTILHNDLLYSKLTNAEYSSSEFCLSSIGYHVFSGNIVNFDSEILPQLLSKGFNLETPTLFIAECILVYIDANVVDRLLCWMSSNISFSMLLCYEQVLKDHAFGNMMITNLQRIGIVLKGLEKYPTTEKQIERFYNSGWKLVESKTIWEIERYFTSPDELSRLNAIERLDEIEEWQLLASHYSVLVALSYKSDSVSSDESRQFKNFLSFEQK